MRFIDHEQKLEDLLLNRAVLSWNFLPDDIENCSNLAYFKRKLKSISFAKASCGISTESLDFDHFYYLLYVVINIYQFQLII